MKILRKNLLFFLCVSFTAGIFLLCGCGSTKIYENQKTVVYEGTLYNISDVKRVQSHVEGFVGGERSFLDLKNTSKEQFESYLEQFDSVFVRMYYTFDEEKVVYRERTVERWRDFRRMKEDFDEAREQITDLMKDKKATQVELR